MVASLPAERLHGGVAVANMAPCGAGCGTSGAGSGAYALQLSDGRRVVADAVVLATPAWASGDLLRNVAPLPAADLSSIEYVSTATCSLAFRRDRVSHDLTGFGFVVPRAEQRPVMATTFSSSKFPGRAPDGHVLLRSFLGRAGIEAAAQLDDDEMVKVVRSELREILGIGAEPEFAEIFRWPRGMPQYRVGHVGPGREDRGRRRPACPASSSPAAPTTASASATACARARPLPSAPSSTCAGCRRTPCHCRRTTCRPATAWPTDRSAAPRA